MESLKCQLNFKTSTQILTNQSQIQTKMQQETKSHPKHIVQTSTTWKVTKYGVISGPYFPAFGLKTERYFVSLRIQSACGEIRTRNNSVFGHLSTSERQLQHQQNYKKKRHKARKTPKKPNCKSPRLNGALENKTLLATQIHLHKMQINRDDRNNGICLV